MLSRSASFCILALLFSVLLATVLLHTWLRFDDAAGRSGRTILKLAHSLDQSHPVHTGMAYMAERLSVLSGGTVELQIFPNSQLGSEPECIEQVLNGALSMVKTSAGAMEGFIPEMAVFSLPYLFRDEEHYWNVLTGPVGEELLQVSRRIGAYGLCYYDTGSRSFYTIHRPILTPEDIRGQKLRVLPSRTAMDMVSEFGGAPTPIPWGELYTALQQGMVDGAENNPPSLLSSRHYEVARHFSLNEHGRVPDILYISKAVWNRLSPQVQAWIQQAADESLDFQRKLWKGRSDEALLRLEESGVQIYRPDPAPFAAAARKLHERYATGSIGIWMQRIQDSD